MDEKTKEAAIEKLGNMAPLIAYPNELLNDEKLNDFYKDMTVDSSSLLGTELSINRFAFERNVKSLYKPVDRLDWTGLFGAASMVNAFYDPTINAIGLFTESVKKALKDRLIQASLEKFQLKNFFKLAEFPSGILQHPFFNADNPWYSNYAGVGFIVGHEMTHGFDDQGRQFDKNGHFLDWWQPETKKKFLENARCIIKQYSNYTVEELGLKVS